MVVLLVEIARQRAALCAWDPQVGRACVEDDLERLAWSTKLDLCEVLCVQIVGQWQVVCLFDAGQLFVKDRLDERHVWSVDAADKRLQVLALDGVDVVDEGDVLQALFERMLVDLG